MNIEDLKKKISFKITIPDDAPHQSELTATLPLISASVRFTPDAVERDAKFMEFLKERATAALLLEIYDDRRRDIVEKVAAFMVADPYKLNEASTALMRALHYSPKTAAPLQNLIAAAETVLQNWDSIPNASDFETLKTALAAVKAETGQH